MYMEIDYEREKRLSRIQIAPYLFLNLTTGLGYDRMGNIPMQRKDFQGYRRKTIETYNRYMMLNGKQIV